VCERDRAVRGDQIGTFDRAEQQGAPGEQRRVVVAVLDQVGQVGQGVPGSGDHPDTQAAGGELVPVAQRMPLEGDLVTGVDAIARTGTPGKLATAAQVVIVDVRLEHVRDRRAALTENHFDPVQVTLPIHHDAREPVGNDVTAVTELRRLDDVDSHATTRVPAPTRARIDPASPAA